MLLGLALRDGALRRAAARDLPNFKFGHEDRTQLVDECHLDVRPAGHMNARTDVKTGGETNDLK